MTGTTSAYRDEWRKGWPALIAAALGGGAATAHFHTLGVMIGPITQSTGWSVAQVTFGMLICSLSVVLAAPLVGWLIDRIGIRPVVLTGLPLFFLSFAAIGPLGGSYGGWVAVWCLIALTSTLVKGNVWVMWIARQFDAARGMALAVLMSGSGLFVVFTPILTQTLVAALGWRQAYPAIAAIMLLLSLPVCWLVLRAPRYDSVAPATLRAQRDNETAGGMTAREAFRTPAFWQLVFASLLAGWGIMSITVFIVPMLEEKAFDARTAAALAGLVGAAAIVGRLTTGILLDRFPARIIGTLSMMLPAIACLVYINVPLDWTVAALVAVLFGLAMGAEGDVVAYLASRHFGLKNFGTIYGFMAGAVGAGAGAGPFTIGLLRDHFGNYGTVAIALCVAMLLTTLLIGTLGSYPGELTGAEPRLEPQAEPVP